MASCKSALSFPPTALPTPTMPPPRPSWFTLLSVLRRWSLCWSYSLNIALWFILQGDLFYVLPCVILFLCFSVLLVLRLPRLGKRELILVFFVRLFNLCLFGFVGFLFLLVSGKGCGLWSWHSLDFSLNYFLIKWVNEWMKFVLLAIFLLLKTNFPYVAPACLRAICHLRCITCYLHISPIGSLGYYAMEYVSLTNHSFCCKPEQIKLYLKWLFFPNISFWCKLGKNQIVSERSILN